ncbi:MAG: ribonuclease HII [Thermoplasmata archaeon]
MVLYEVLKSFNGKDLIAGIDEAGRGPVIGPMVVAIVGTDNEIKTNESFYLYGIKDSKLLSPVKRSLLYEKILEEPLYIGIGMLSPRDIDNGMGIMSLNDLELVTMAQLIKGNNFKKVYVDSCDVNEERFKINLLKKIGSDIEIISKHKADQIYPLVSAASIIAKVKRDCAINEIKKVTKIDFGSGYPSDPKTIKAINNNFDILLPYIRKKWKTVNRKVVKNIDEF